MGFKTTITIKHATDGYSFKLDVDRNADALGIKVLIWEIQKVPIESQRLVFNGKEMTDNQQVSELDMVDNDTIFLIEAKKQEIVSATAVEPITITPSYIEQAQIIEKPIQSEPLHIPVPVPDDNDYAHFDGLAEQIDEQKVYSVVKLSAWIRAYLWFGFILTFLATLFCCTYSVIPFIFYAFGLVGARKLCKCLLAFPIILTAIIGLGGLTVNVIWFYDIYQLIPIFISIFHIIIFSCICKLVIKIAQLNKTEYKQARARIYARKCCC